MKKSMYLAMILTTAVVFGVISCSKKAKSGPQFIYRPAPSKDAVAKMNGVVITKAELYSGIESDVYEAEMKLYEIKKNRLEALILQKFIDADPRKVNLSNDEFLDKYIANNLKVSDKRIKDFANGRKIPAKQLNAQLKERIRQFLLVTVKKEAIDNWLGEKTRKSPVEVYLEEPVRPVFDVNIEGAPFYGASDAKVTLVEFSDFQCPFCAKGAKIIGELKKKYGKKVKVVYKNFPLPFHTHAKIAANAAMCASEQGSELFWKFHDKMFGDQTKLDEKGLKASAKELGLNVENFNKCLASKKYANKIAKDIEDGKKVGVKSTPTFYVNGQMVNGAQSVEVFSKLIDKELAK